MVRLVSCCLSSYVAAREVGKDEIIIMGINVRLGSIFLDYYRGLGLSFHQSPTQGFFQPPAVSLSIGLTHIPSPNSPRILWTGAVRILAGCAFPVGCDDEGCPMWISCRRQRQPRKIVKRIQKRTGHLLHSRLAGTRAAYPASFSRS